MSLMCAYQNCLCIKYPCGTTAFFRLPTDDRRSTWIKNSGNKSLQNISAKAHRFFCENHFRECDIRIQFNRKILRKQAVPVAHESCKVALESVVMQQVADYSRLNRNQHECQNRKDKDETDFIIEKLDHESSTIHLYEEVEVPEMENQADDDITIEERIENSYLLDFYSPSPEDEESQELELELEPSKVCSFEVDDELDNHLEEIHFEEANCNEVESSIFALPNDSVNSSVELEVQPEIPTKKRKRNEDAYTESTHDEKNTLQQATTSNNDYEEDKHFALSLVGYFQRLPNGQKAMAKLKILQYLTELETAMPGNLNK